MPHTVTSDDEYYAFLQESLANSRRGKTLLDKVCNLPFEDKYHTTTLDLGIVFLIYENVSKKTLSYVAISKTEQARQVIRMTSKPINDIQIPLSNKKNILCKAILEQKIYWTNDWQYIFTPVIDNQESQINQSGAGIACSVIYPLGPQIPRAALVFSYFQDETRLKPEHHKFMKYYSAITSQILNTTR